MTLETGNLEVWDIVVVSNPIGMREYPVTSIEWNKAHTGFRIFHRKIYPTWLVYEYWKNPYSTVNWYRIKEVLPT